MGSANQLKLCKQQKLEFVKLVHSLASKLCVCWNLQLCSSSTSNQLPPSPFVSELSFSILFLRFSKHILVLFLVVVPFFIYWDHNSSYDTAMIQERASLPIISLQPVVAGAAKKTSNAVGQATKTFMNIISRGEFTSENEDDSGIDRVEI
jgi:hypothetical protein